MAALPPLRYALPLPASAPRSSALHCDCSCSLLPFLRLKSYSHSDRLKGSRQQYARKAGIEKLAPHDLRRTCARLCHQAGGELDQIQFLLGHVSMQTTERYLGCKQRIRDAVNDRISVQPKRRASPGP
ncbi:MAG: tyrosine-type recombinase/integrase [Acidobacteria bacterium]|nr:tyrosine-type recombinase/integrase [Acidobacteriota bacterium]